ncbi:MAG: metal-dependent hydrolase [Methanobacteriota archaeon]
MLIGSGFPNFDVFPTLLRKETPDNPINETHAATILHTLFLYIIILPFMYLGLNALGWSNSWVIAMSFSLGGVIHVLTESFDEKGRRLLYPISKKFYGIRVLPYDFWTYLTDKKVLALEGGLFIVAFLLLVF